MGCFGGVAFGKTGLGVFSGASDSGTESFLISGYTPFFVATLNLPLLAELSTSISVCGSCLGLSAALGKLRLLRRETHWGFVTAPTRTF